MLNQERATLPEIEVSTVKVGVGFGMHNSDQESPFKSFAKSIAPN